MKTGYLQFKPEFCNPEANIKKISSLIKNTDFDLIVMPELSNSGYLFNSTDELEKNAEKIPDGKFCEFLLSLAKQKNGCIICGIAENDDGKFYNSSVLACPGGDLFKYRKIHLFNEEKKWFTPGDEKFSVNEIIVNGENVKTGMMICYDWIYPEAVRTLALHGAQVICHPANLVMPYCQDAMFARAVENRVFVITANRIGDDINNGRSLHFTGQSVIVDPKGNYLHRGSLDSEECIIIDIDPIQALDKKINDYNSLFDDLRNEMYY
jgi:predicted amidohydrolase